LRRLTHAAAKSVAPPFGAAEFAACMTACRPFEPRPVLVIAVSGGADSMALALLAAAWARARRGRAIALTVDHGLRADSAAEARGVGAWLKRRGIEHHILRWRGPKPISGLQAAARAARYRLLVDWCRARGILHLLLAHHRGDQAETVLLRLAAGSGPFGLAGMARVQERAALRLVRPLLGIERPRLEATLAAMGQSWIEDPSNRDPRFARARVRARLDDATAERIAGAAGALGRFRADEERAIAGLLARAVVLDARGFARLDCAILAAAPADRARRSLGALLTTVGGREFPPRDDELRKLLGALSGGLRAGRTLGGCRLLPEGNRCLVLRETRGIETIRLGAAPALWDGRFRVAGSAGETVAPLGAEGWAEALAAAPALRAIPIPYPARLSLPAIRGRRGLVAIPALGFALTQTRSRKKTANARFLPIRPLASAVFAASLSGRVALEGEASPVV